jgi:hypothetical protein
MITPSIVRIEGANTPPKVPNLLDLPISSKLVKNHRSFDVIHENGHKKQGKMPGDLTESLRLKTD